MRDEPAIRNIPASFEHIAGTLLGAAPERYKVVSLFSGCGGMDLGFLGGFGFGSRYYDRQPFEVVWANDVNATACQTYERNLRHEIKQGNITDMLDTLPATADVLIGGFPCQDVSINGRQPLENGERTVLYRQMIEAIRRTKPQVFVAENVKGLQQAHGRDFYERMLADFRATGYRVIPQLYMASAYGVPQQRERIFIVGYKGRRKFVHPAPLSSSPMTARDALRDLENTPEDPAISHVWSKAAHSPEQGSRRLAADKPATTIRAEHHGNTQWHYSRYRRISLREAARLQSFPDEFQFVGGMREVERQIGNAVPPVLAWHLAKAVREHLDAGRVRGGVGQNRRVANQRLALQHDVPRSSPL